LLVRLVAGKVSHDWNASPDEEVAPQRGTTDRFTLA